MSRRVSSGQGKVREIPYQAKVREFCYGQGKLKMLWKVREKSGNFERVMAMVVSWVIWNILDNILIHCWWSWKCGEGYVDIFLSLKLHQNSVLCTVWFLNSLVPVTSKKTWEIHFQSGDFLVKLLWVNVKVLKSTLVHVTACCCWFW